MQKPTAVSSARPGPWSASPALSAVQSTAAVAKPEAASDTRAAAPSPSRMPPSMSLATTGLRSSSSLAQTARRQSRSEPTQPRPVSSSAPPAMPPMVAAFWTRPLMSIWSAIPGICSVILRWRVSSWCCESRAAPTAATTASSGKRERKLVKVIAAASRVQCTVWRWAKARQAWVRIAAAIRGPIHGNFVNQSITGSYPSPVRAVPRNTNVRVPQNRRTVASAMPIPAPDTTSARGPVKPST
jgi:hypothetical protein